MPEAGKRTTTKKGTKARSPRCHTCGKPIRVPAGWSVGPAVRRHYWSKHRAVMTGGRSR